MITTANVISYAISVVSVLITIYVIVKNSTKEDSSMLTTVIVKLENIESVGKETQRDVRDVISDMRSMDKRVTRLETLVDEKNDGK